ncbi:TetR family transcriptional regulator [Deinococcus aetherius]|uniref:TetR family transcriptional regulator n=1 Tax=Deinococcus aetherius TaxID=200252 RepID=A0ABN6RF50_9DEIO|nr:TetR/AcrR family transcriptional regulator [Deinococcus aetherius]BDP40514.1 TetR family transcriptional regulator [Deinococcus aetherius]
MSGKPDTRTRILDVAQGLVQERGDHAVRYKDIGEWLGLCNASIHHHFPGKTGLGASLVRRYRERRERLLESLAAHPSARRLDRYVAASREVVHEDGRIRLCTVLAAEDRSLPEAIRGEVSIFSDLNEDWLSRVLEEGRGQGELHFPGDPRETGSTFLATLEGAMLLARSSRDPGRFEHICRRSVAALRAA